MPSVLDRPHRWREVRVIGSRDGDRIDLVAQLIEQFPPISKATGRGERLARLSQTAGIHITNPDNILGRARLSDVGPPFSTHADGCDAKSLIGAQHPTTTDIGELASTQISPSGEQDGIPKKLTT